MATSGIKSAFAKYIADEPAPVEPTPEATSPEVRRLLHWLQGWEHPTISLRDIYRHYDTGEKEKALKISRDARKARLVDPAQSASLRQQKVAAYATPSVAGGL